MTTTSHPLCKDSQSQAGKGALSGILLMVAYALLGSGLLLRNGHYSPLALGLLMVSFACTGLAFTCRDGREPGRLALLAVIAFFLLLNARTPPGIYLTSAWFAPAYQIFCGSLLLLMSIIHLPVLQSHVLALRLIPKAHRIFISVAVIGAVFFRIMMPIASPAPIIDVFSYSQEATEYLLEGRNPYVEEMRDVYQGRANFVVPRHYVYPPANLYLLAIAKYAFGDVRYISVAADLIVALVLYVIARTRWSPEGARLLPLLFLFHPRSLFVIEQAWTEPMLLGAFALFLLLQVYGRRTGAVAIYGYFLSLKQYVLFFVLEWFIIERNIWRLLLGITVVAVTAAPFALWNFGSFWEQGMLFNITHTGFRADSLSISSVLYPLIGPINKSLSVVIGGVVGVWSFLAMRQQGLPGYLWAVTITTYAMFLFGSQAFCNYYYFVGGLLLFTLLLLPEGTTLTDRISRTFA